MPMTFSNGLVLARPNWLDRPSPPLPRWGVLLVHLAEDNASQHNQAPTQARGGSRSVLAKGPFPSCSTLLIELSAWHCNAPLHTIWFCSWQALACDVGRDVMMPNLKLRLGSGSNGPGSGSETPNSENTGPETFGQRVGPEATRAPELQTPRQGAGSPHNL